ncbi:hypothetical protein PVAND_005417 [Polypedilum vanderplanki]|uniref:Serpin domain-containing protein n=1 Tax=Polypedilum vanderplanki TaxID=319348 RepID=A0A9J6BZX5_POLVA|nr:hypothetical protein PVAND_005417 [Polypedilum vanderplanki]
MHINKVDITFLLIALAVVLITVSGQSSRSPYARLQSTNFFKSQPEQLSAEDQSKLAQQIALGVLQLSQQLTERTLASTTNKFEVLSPLSVASALQLALLAAKGQTYDELIQVMNYGNYSPRFIHQEFSEILNDLKLNKHSPKRDKVKWRENANEQYLQSTQRFEDHQTNYEHHKIEVANGIFVQNDVNIRGAYKDAVQNVYKSEVKSLNFRDAPSDASQQINDWVNEKTHGKIKQIVPPVMNPNTRIVLANALYFKAQWQTSFFEGATKPKKFFPYGRSRTDDYIMADLMAHGGYFPHYYDPETNVEILGLPYKQNCTTMYIILPKDSNMDRIKEVQKQLTAEKIEDLIDKMTVKSAVMLFPKMHLKSGYHFKSDLQELGVKSLFEQDKSDLSLLSEGEVKMKNRNETFVFPQDPLTRMGKRNKRDITYKVPSENKKSSLPLSIKDFFNRKRIIKSSKGKKNNKRTKRDAIDSLSKLDQLRNLNLINPQLFADEVIHKVDLTINEKGTEGGASTLVTINRSTTVVFRVDIPFMFLIRHDPTKIPLFYGVVFQPPATDEVNEDCEKMLNNEDENSNS